MRWTDMGDSAASAPMRPYQHGLPLIEVDRQLGPASSKAPVRKPERRAIHVSGYQREGRDFYATPSWVTEALLQHVSLWGPVWEPCCGDGAMATVLAAHGHEVVSSDIADCGFGTPGIDFLTSERASGSRRRRSRASGWESGCVP